jgi:hypothetical protein
MVTQMMESVESLLRGGGRALRGELELAAAGLRRSLAAAGLVALAGCAAVAGGVGLLVALAVVLAREVGPAGGIAIAGGSGLVVAGVLLLAARRLGPGAMDTDGREAAEAKVEQGTEEMREAVGLNEEPRERTTLDPARLVEKAARFAAEHPAEVAGAAFALLAVIGPGRVLRVASRTAAVASAAAAVAKVVRERGEDGASADAEGARSADGAGSSVRL